MDERKERASSPGPAQSADAALALRQSLRDLAGVAMLPASWVDCDARQIAESLSGMLVRTMGLEFVFIALKEEADGSGAPPVRVLHCDSPASAEQEKAVAAALGPWIDSVLPRNPISLSSPLGKGALRAVFLPFVAGIDGVIVAASRAQDFPTSTQRLVLGIAANQAAIAMRRLRAEQALQRLATTLEQRVGQEIRERMKVEEALRASHKLEAVGRLTGGIAHDFNNLLATVLANLELLRKRVAGEPAALRILDRAVEGAERGGSLTRRLLAFARQQDLRPEVIDVADLIEDLIDILQPSIGARYQIDTSLPSGLWPVRADSNQLQLALFNLAINASEAMPDGGLLHLSARNDVVKENGGRALKPGEYVCIAVTDNGVGMDAETLARAADPFFTTKGMEKGSGLGLSVVHGMAAQSLGELRLDSRPGEGTTAELRLPRAIAAARPDTLPPAPAPQLHDCTILLVEDDMLLRMSTADMIRDLGHRALEASSGAEALDILRGGAPVDLVITDQLMPGMTGTQLIAELRRTWPAMPVLLATGYTALLKGRDIELPRLDKPFGERALAAAISDVMGGQAATSA